MNYKNVDRDCCSRQDQTWWRVFYQRSEQEDHATSQSVMEWYYPEFLTIQQNVFVVCSFLSNSVFETCLCSFFFNFQYWQHTQSKDQKVFLKIFHFRWEEKKERRCLLAILQTALNEDKHVFVRGSRYLNYDYWEYGNRTRNLKVEKWTCIQCQLLLWQENGCCLWQ